MRAEENLDYLRNYILKTIAFDGVKGCWVLAFWFGESVCKLAPERIAIEGDGFELTSLHKDLPQEFRNLIGASILSGQIAADGTLRMSLSNDKTLRAPFLNEIESWEMDCYFHSQYICLPGGGWTVFES